MRSRTFFALLVVALLAATATPAAAAARDPRAARDAARSRRARLASQLNTIRATESQLVRAARLLDQQVAAQVAAVEAAHQAAAVSNDELLAATHRLDTTRASLTRLNHQAVERAVEAYISPHVAGAGGFGDLTDLAAAARRKALLDAVGAGDRDLIDRLGAAREDYAIEMQAAQAARERTRAREAATRARLGALGRDRASQSRLASAVLARKRDVLGEIVAQSRAEAELTRIIRQRSALGSHPSTGRGTAARNASGCIWPARGSVTSGFGRRWGRLHAGIDVANRIGTPIWAAKAGTVIFTGRQSGYGNVVIIDHGNGLSTLYGHQSRIAARRGQRVGQGQVIGYIGSTGHSTGPHVHFETRYNGVPRNPRSCLP